LINQLNWIIASYQFFARECEIRSNFVGSLRCERSWELRSNLF